jgi:hypothetical protein
MNGFTCGEIDSLGFPLLGEVFTSPHYFSSICYLKNKNYKIPTGAVVELVETRLFLLLLSI